MKKFLTTVLAILMLISCICLSSCAEDSPQDYVGEYESVFVDSQNSYDSLTFVLEIKEDGTFKLKGNDDTINGTWKTYTEGDATQVLCIADDSYRFSREYPTAWNPYFTLCFLDDGTLMASSGSTSSTMKAYSAFGMGVSTLITLILFERTVEE